MDHLENSSEIKRLLKMKGNKRLEIRDDITSTILDYSKNTIYPGVQIKFLESRLKSTDMGSWVEYNILFEIHKMEESSVDYLSEIFKILGLIIKQLKDLEGIEQSGIQEVECGISKYYYLLIYLHGEGTEEKIQEKINF